MERTAVSKMTENLESNHNMSPHQYGFRSGRSTEDQLLLTYDVVGLATSVASLGLATMRSLLVRYFPYLPTEFDSTTTPADYYDFIVVGSGCGGSVVASRLSETTASVLLLEAGISAPPETVTYISRFFSYFGNSNSDWHYEIKPQNNAYLGFINNTLKVRHAKVMGGASTSNAMTYTRGNKMDFDSWASLGNSGWDYDSVLPYFKKSENLHAPDFAVEEKYHGRTGPLPVSTTEADSDIVKQFLIAGQQLGYKTIDPSEAHNLGFFSAHKTQLNGVRASASESFLGPVVDRPNLQIRTNALVTRVLFNDKKRAVGVEYVIDGKRRTVLARKEVILSAGPIKSPQLLLLSGVGPRKHLEEMGIPVVANVPGVGRNLHDHSPLFLPMIVKQGAYSPFTDSINIGALTEFITNASGPLTLLSGEGWTLMNVGGDIHPSWPDVLMELASDTFSTVGAELTADQFGYRPEIFEDTFGKLDGLTTFSFMPMLARPKSRGSITLKSTNPADNPIIDINMFDHPDDIKLFVKAIRKCFEIARTPAFRDTLDVRVPDNQLTQCRSDGRDTDAYWECYLRHMAFAGYHLTSSVLMALPSNPMGVVSQRLSVRGVTSLRVVDSSIMPHNTAGNPMATTYMIGEKGADLIKEDWGYFTETHA